MAILHEATLTPGKAELVEQWLDRQPWGGQGRVELLGSYRFDDPDGAVGVEGFVVRRGASLLHVPMTYRAAPLEGAEEHLVGTMDHSVLGQRWVYDAVHDPAAAGCFERALAGDQEQATLELYDDGELVRRPESGVRLRRQARDGAPPGELHVVRDLTDAVDGHEQLVATWRDGEAVVAAR
jgi:hypothetical protein